ncbi:MAG: BLUF domain-containing protein, partial [Acetobacteraceae bacterium]|nr:BLUF domain-containing protein [Acetobacteraceae bacterium]
IYCSRSTLSSDAGDAVAHDELAEILRTSRANNGRFGLTGALLYSDQCFAQVLEGPLPAVERVFERILRDPRHGQVTVLGLERAERRLFGAWSMAFAGRPGLRTLLAGAAVDDGTVAPSDSAGRDVLALLTDVIRAEDYWAITA